MLLTLLHGVAQFLGVGLVTCQKKGAEPRCCLRCLALFCTLFALNPPSVHYLWRVCCGAALVPLS